jgi:Transposase DNA-binding
MEFRLVDEFKESDFGDLRLSKRLNKVADAFGSNPHLSIPAALHSRSDLDGAYRFFDNPKDSPDEIHRPHAERSVERISKTSVALLVQDTTDIDLTRPSRIVVGSGSLGSDPCVGAFLHPVFAFDTQGIPLGTVWSKM